MASCERNSESLGSNNSGQFLGRLTVSQTGPCFKKLVDYRYKVLRFMVRTTISCLLWN